MNFSLWSELLLSLILGFIQGITEFLPISSTAHLLLVSQALSGKDIGLSASNVIQLGTLIAILHYYRQKFLKLFSHLLDTASSLDKIRRLLKNNLQAFSGKPKHPKDFQNLIQKDQQELDILSGQLVVATIPIVVFGFWLQDFAQYLRANLLNVAGFLLMGSLLMGFSELFRSKLVAKSTKNKADQHSNASQNQVDFSSFTFSDSLIIGFFQALAIFPGMSRSGSTLSGALILNKDRYQSINFSFFLSIPAIFLASINDLVKLFFVNTASVSWLPSKQGWTDSTINLSVLTLAIALIASYIFGTIFLNWLLKFLKNHSNLVFVVYRILLAGCIVVAFWL